MSPAIHRSAEDVVDAIIRDVGKEIVLGLPLGLGKANTIVNALFARAVADPSLRLTIYTALTPEVPHGSSELERRFLAPFARRVFGGYPELAYVKTMRAGALPTNISVSEFFFLAGRWLSVPYAQQNYISADYTHAARYLIERGVNVITQLVARRQVDGETRYSLGSNTDTTLDFMAAQAAGKTSFLFVGEVNSEMPFMPGEGDLSAGAFAHVLDDPSTDYPLFSAPKEPVSHTEYATGLHVARLIPDGGTLQIGIGKQADALVHALTLRQHENRAFRDAAQRLSPNVAGEDAPFVQGLYGVSEMFVDGFLSLIDAGILKRENDGVLLHAGFFLGTRAFYKRLREMEASTLDKIRMVAISFTNDLYGDEALKRRQRVKARFVNNAMMVTALGAVVSDGLADGRIVSGVGGQYNFVAQAFALEDARSVITLPATRLAKGKLVSNIVWSYPHQTVPRHLRDIIVTEYGVADLRGKSDAEVIAAMLAITDSRFQSSLLKEAKAAGKIAANYEIPPAFRNNTPARLAAALGSLEAQGHLPAFPFGSDFTEVEQRLLPALAELKAATPVQLFSFALRGLSARADSDQAECLARLDLAVPRSAKERFFKWLVLGAMA